MLSITRWSPAPTPALAQWASWKAGPSCEQLALTCLTPPSSFHPSLLLMDQWWVARKRVRRPEAVLGEAISQLYSSSCREPLLPGCLPSCCSDLSYACLSSTPPSNLWFDLLPLHVFPSSRSPIPQSQCTRFPIRNDVMNNEY